jgi:hypothetical protein
MERNNTAMRPPGVLVASEDNSEVLSDLAPLTPPQVLFSEPPSMSRTSTIGDYEVSTCDWAESGFVDGLSCTKFDVPDFPMGDDILPQLGFCEMGAAEFGAMQDPLEIV